MPRIAAFLAAALWAVAAVAQTMSVDHVYARATPPGAPTGAAYLTIVNGTGQSDRLVGVESNRADRVEMHTTIKKDGMMSMQKLSGVDVPAGKSVAFEPGGRHIMLIGLHDALKAGQTFSLTLVFEKAGRRQVQVEVRDLRGSGMGGMKGMNHDDME